MTDGLIMVEAAMVTGLHSEIARLKADAEEKLQLLGDRNKALAEIAKLHDKVEMLEAIGAPSKELWEQDRSGVIAVSNRLRAENKRLRETLERIVELKDMHQWAGGMAEGYTYLYSDTVKGIARAALKGEGS